MRYKTSDIKNVENFAEKLKQVCDDILENGMPKSRACEKYGVSLSMFDSVMRGLRKSDTPPQGTNVRYYKPWQDRLITDLGGSEDTYIPEDFEEELQTLENTFLSEEESTVIKAYYPENKTLKKISDELCIAQSTAGARLNSALRKLRKHREELFHGKEYEARISELEKLGESHRQELHWILDAINSIKTIDPDAETPIDKAPISEEAKAFYRKNGFSKIGDIMELPLSELFVKVTDAADDAGAFLTISGDNGISPDTPVRQLGLKPQTVSILEWNHISTVRDVLRLSAEDILSIPHLSAEQVLHIYRLVLFGED